MPFKKLKIFITNSSKFLYNFLCNISNFLISILCPIFYWIKQNILNIYKTLTKENIINIYDTLNNFFIKLKYNIITKKSTLLTNFRINRYNFFKRASKFIGERKTKEGKIEIFIIITLLSVCVFFYSYTDWCLTIAESFEIKVNIKKRVNKYYLFKYIYLTLLLFFIDQFIRVILKPNQYQKKYISIFKETLEPLRIFIKKNSMKFQIVFIVVPYIILLIIIGASLKLQKPVDYEFIVNTDYELYYIFFKKPYIHFDEEAFRNTCRINTILYLIRIKQLVRTTLVISCIWINIPNNWVDTINNINNLIDAINNGINLPMG